MTTDKTTVMRKNCRGREATMLPAEYLKRPYGRTVIPESDGTFRAEIPGCIAVGDTAGEALASLEDVAESWLASMLANGKPVPAPIEDSGFSGKLVVRLPKSLHRKAAQLAARDGVSLNQFIVSGVAQQVGSYCAQPHYSQTIVTDVMSVPATRYAGAWLVSGSEVMSTTSYVGTWPTPSAQTGHGMILLGNPSFALPELQDA
jgi:predicted HicB family RNase H-like nuclease